MTSKKKEEKSSFIDSIIDFGQRKINGMVKEFVEEKITKQLVRIGEISFALMLGTILVIIGITQYLASLLSFLENGLNYILMGCILLIIAYVLNERSQKE